MDNDCPMCGGEPGVLGPLGEWLWLRCVDCGWEWHVVADLDDVFEFEEVN